MGSKPGGTPSNSHTGRGVPPESGEGISQAEV